MAETIKVAVRVRPLVQKELDEGAVTSVSTKGNVVTVQTRPQVKAFGFDHAYWSADPKDPHYASQDVINNDIGKPCIENMLKGYNFCVFAYGQTGAGKTYTLSTCLQEKNLGLIPFVLEGLFSQHKAKFRNDELRIWISFMEIYNEQIRDLLSPGREMKDLKVRDHPELGAYVPGLTEAPCREMADVKKLMDFGTKRRVTAATNMNSSSSRSHAVFTIRAQRLQGPKPAVGKPDNRKSLSSKVNLVDLAGSERLAKTGAEGMRLREGCAINQSLTALGLVIKQIGDAQRAGRRQRSILEEKSKSIPFRASKLTFLLRESLAGNSRTFMVAAISPASTCVEETLTTLRFASSVKRVKTVAIQNVDRRDELVASLQAEVSRLNEMLVGSGAGDATRKNLHDDIAERERLLGELTKSHAQQLREARALQAAREEVLRDMGLTQQDVAETIGIDKDVPYLLNMNEDPALSGKMMYFLPAGSTITIGSSIENKIVVQGLGIPEFLCEIKYQESHGVMVSTLQQGTEPSRLSMKARVCINGTALKLNEERKLKHNDKLFLGRASVLRLIVPETARALGQAETILTQSEHNADRFRAMVPEDSRAWAELQLYLEDLRYRLGEESGRELFQTLIEASDLVDEANEITSAVRPGDHLKFEVELVWDIHRAARDIVVIRQTRTPEIFAEEAGTPTSNHSDTDHSVVVAYWTLSKFKARLDQMRDCYESHTVGRWDGLGDCLRDPWMEPSIIELRHRLVSHIDAESQRMLSKESKLHVKPAEAPSQQRNGSKNSSTSMTSLAASVLHTQRIAKVQQPSIVRKSLVDASRKVSFKGESARLASLPISDISETCFMPSLFSKSLPPKHLMLSEAVAEDVGRKHPLELETELQSVSCHVPGEMTNLLDVRKEEHGLVILEAASTPLNVRENVIRSLLLDPEISSHIAVAQNLENEEDRPNTAMEAQLQSETSEDDEDRLNAAMEAQLRDKEEKEELYKLRIEYLQQQISLYNQLACAAASPAQVRRHVVQALQRGRSSSLEPPQDASSLVVSSSVRSLSAHDILYKTTADAIPSPIILFRQLSPTSAETTRSTSSQGSPSAAREPTTTAAAVQHMKAYQTPRHQPMPSLLTSVKTSVSKPVSSEHKFDQLPTRESVRQVVRLYAPAKEPIASSAPAQAGRERRSRSLSPPFVSRLPVPQIVVRSVQGYYSPAAVGQVQLFPWPGGVTSS